MTRLDKLRSAMRDKDIAAVIVYDEINQRYLSDFSFSDGLLFITHNSAHLLTDFIYPVRSFVIVTLKASLTPERAIS